MPNHDEHKKLEQLLERNANLVEENNKILRKLYRNSIISLAWKVIAFLLIIGIPFALYFYILQPYFQAFGSDFATFRAGVNELPGIKGFEQFLDAIQGTSTPSSE